jgi:hypothetical protein
VHWVKWLNPNILDLGTIQYKLLECELLLQVQLVNCAQILKSVSEQWDESLYKVHKTSSFGCI